MPLALPAQNPLSMPLVPLEPPPEELPPLEPPSGVVLTPAIGGSGVAGGAHAEKKNNKYIFMDFTFLINNKDIKVLTSLFQIKAPFENINQWVFSLVTESAHVVVHINGPHHCTSEVILLQPVNLQTARRGGCRLQVN